MQPAKKTMDALAAAQQSAQHSATDIKNWMQCSLEDDESFAPDGKAFATERIWFGLMTTRLMVASFLFALQGLLWWLRDQYSAWLAMLCLLYFAVTLIMRLYLTPVKMGKPFERYWLPAVGLDLLTFALLIWFDRREELNYAPLLALPAMICAVLGTQRTTLLSIAISGVLLGANNWYHYQHQNSDGQILHIAGIVLYILAMLLVTSVLHRIVRNYDEQEAKSLSSQRLARLHSRIQDMLVQNVRDGVIVVGGSGRLRAINQTAQDILQIPETTRLAGVPIEAIDPIAPLKDLIQQCFKDGKGTSFETVLFPKSSTPVHLMVQAQLSIQSDSRKSKDEPLCLLYLQDMQELQNKIRSEKLAAMGRMSAAVAHEIRNPLAAIGQAAQLLAEEIEQPLQKKLNDMVLHNVQRLNAIVSDVLEIARMQQSPLYEVALLPLDASVQQFCDEWVTQNKPTGKVLLFLHAGATQVRFDLEHLRRVMVNLLDNAQRHAQQGDNARIAVVTCIAHGKAQLHVWSRGSTLPPALRSSLFEPLSAGTSRTSGLGLYICRELCQRYRADIHHHWLPLESLVSDGPADIAEEEGNAFSISIPLNLETQNVQQADLEVAHQKVFLP